MIGGYVPNSLWVMHTNGKRLGLPSYHHIA